MYFLTFLDIEIVDLNVLFALLQHTLERRGEVVFGQRPDDPLPLRLELVLGQGEARQLLLQFRKQEEVGRGQVRRVRGMGKDLDRLFG